MLSSEDILSQVKKVFVERFKVDEARITGDANLFQDLDLDSIDLFDLLVAVEESAGRTLQHDRFRNVRTVNELVATLEAALAE